MLGSIWWGMEAAGRDLTLIMAIEALADEAVSAACGEQPFGRIPVGGVPNRTQRRGTAASKGNQDGAERLLRTPFLSFRVPVGGFWYGPASIRPRMREAAARGSNCCEGRTALLAAC